MKKMNKKGFTIVELTTVIAVIAILAAVLIPTFSGIVKKANQSAAQQEAAALYKEAYALDLADGTLDGYEGPKSDNNKIKKVEDKDVQYYAQVKENGDIWVSFGYVYKTNKYFVTFDGKTWTVKDYDSNNNNTVPTAPESNTDKT